MEPLTLWIACALALIVAIRWPPTSMPQLIAPPIKAEWAGLRDEDEQQPQHTVHGPSLNRMLLWIVAAVAVVRLAAFLAFGA